MSHLWAEFVNFVTLYLQNTLSTMTSSQLPAHFVITIGRSFGAGGRALGQILAKRLGFAYYDKELLNEAAARAGLDLSIFEKNDERAPGFLSGLLPMSMGYNALAWYTGPNSVSGESVYGAQSDFIREIAAKGPCVIVGRTADYVLRDFPGAVNIFLHAPEDECVKRIMRATTAKRSRKPVLFCARPTNCVPSSIIFTPTAPGATPPLTTSLSTHRVSGWRPSPT